MSLLIPLEFDHSRFPLWPGSLSQNQSLSYRYPSMNKECQNEERCLSVSTSMPSIHTTIRRKATNRCQRREGDKKCPWDCHHGGSAKRRHPERALTWGEGIILSIISEVRAYQRRAEVWVIPGTVCSNSCFPRLFLVWLCLKYSRYMSTYSHKYLFDFRSSQYLFTQINLVASSLKALGQSVSS